MGASQAAGGRRARQKRALRRAEMGNGLEPRRAARTPSDTERLGRVYDAVEDLIHEVGLDRMTLTDVVRRANVNSSFLYDFYPNKAALVRAAGQDRLDKTRAILLEALSAVNSTDSEAIIETVLPLIWHRMIAGPKISSFFVSMMADPDLRALDAEDTTCNAAILAQAFGAWFPRYTAAQTQAFFEMMIVTFGGMVRQSLLVPATRHDDLLLVMTDMLRSVVRVQSEGPAQASAGAP